MLPGFIVRVRPNELLSDVDCFSIVSNGIVGLVVAGANDAKVKETMSQFSLNPPLPSEEAHKLFTEQTPLWVQFMEGVGIKPE